MTNIETSNFESLAKNLMQSFENDDSTKEESLSLKKEIATGFVEKLEKEGKLGILSMFGAENAKETILDYLISEDLMDKVLDNAKRNLFFSKLHDENGANDIAFFKKRLDNAHTKSDLDLLKSEITGGSVSSTSSSESTSSANISNETVSEENDLPEYATVGVAATATLTGGDNLSEYINASPLEKEYVKNVISHADKKVGCPYERGGASGNGFDCSGLRNWSFKQEGLQFSDRFTANLFEKTTPHIPTEKVQPGDFMFRERKPGTKKHNDIYHIEMAVGKPFLKSGKRYIKTLGSSSDGGAVDAQGNKVGKGVGYRTREISQYRHFSRPPYFKQLAEHHISGDPNDLKVSAYGNVA